MTSPDTEARAKELFFAYDGSPFYMDRDGVYDEFRASNIPRETSDEWMRELTAKHLAGLAKPGNWWSLHFLSHHSKYGYVTEALAARPLGLWWEKVAFLEELLWYVRQARWTFHATGSDLARAARITLEYEHELLADAREQDDRVEKLMRNARRRARWRF